MMDLTKIRNFGFCESEEDGSLNAWCDLEDGKLLLVTMNRGERVMMSVHDVGMPPYDEQKDEE